MRIGNTILLFALGLAVAVTSCKDPDEVKETCIPPASPVASNDGPKALGSTIQLSATTVEGATYSWTGPNKFSATAQNPVVTYSGPTVLGEYSVVAIVNGCSSAKGFTYVTACDTPMVTSNSPVAMGATLNLSTDVIPGATYTWSKVGTPGFTSNEPSFSIASVHDSMAGTYQVSITYGSCTTPIGSTNVVIVPAAPAVTAPSSIVVGSTLTMSATSVTSGVVFHWEGPDDFDTIAQTVVIDPVGRRHGGDYFVTAIKNGLESAATKKTVTVNFNTTAGCGGATSVTGGGFTYRLVEITSGAVKQCWMQTNLKQAANDSLMTWDELMATTSVETAQQGLCPVGFHVPSDGEWTILANGVNNDANALKEVGQGSGAGAGTNTSGLSIRFSAAPKVFFWTATPSAASSDFIWYRSLEKTNNAITRDNIRKNPTSSVPNYSVRCIKD